MTTANIDLLLSRLDGVKQTAPNKWLAKCPAHDDRHASFGVKLTDEGAILLNCFAGCDTGVVLEAIGLSFVDLFPARSAADCDPSKPRPKPPKFTAGEMVRLAVKEATLLALGIEFIQSGGKLPETDNLRIQKAVETIDAIRRELQHA